MLPIIVIVSLLCLSISPVPTGLLLSFLVGSLLVIAGIGLFSLGTEMAMTPIGSRIGAAMTKSRKVWLILTVSFVLGAAVTVAEPDLQVLAQTVPHINSRLLILTVSVGVGMFLMLCMLRILLGIRLRWVLLGAYLVVLALAAFTEESFLGIAFDAGGVTTGPMTVPFILALGVGVSRIRSDRQAEADSFGLVALCSIGPILAVLILGFFCSGEGQAASVPMKSWGDTAAIGRAYLRALPDYAGETAIALAPIALIFVLFQLISLRMPARSFLGLTTGLLYTFVGLVLFLTGINVGFSELGYVLGAALAVGRTRVLLIPLAMLLGWCIIRAEPAVTVLQRQIEEISAGAIPGTVLRRWLSAAIALASGAAMLRVLTGISLAWFLVPGYALALALTFFVPDIYTAIAFDSGGVASGPMTAAFMLPLMLGVSSAVGGSGLTDAFGLVALVAMMPLLSIQLMGLVCSRRTETAAERERADDEIIELWEVAG